MEVVVVVEEGGMDPAAAASAGAGAGAKRARARTITRAMARAAPPLRSGGGGPPRCRSAGAMPAGREAAGGGGTLRLLFDGILLARVRAYCTYSIHTTTMYYICIAIHTTSSYSSSTLESTRVWIRESTFLNSMHPSWVRGLSEGCE